MNVAEVGSLVRQGSSSTGSAWSQDRYLPDKAIDLLDETGARVQLRQGIQTEVENGPRGEGALTGPPPRAGLKNMTLNLTLFLSLSRSGNSHGCCLKWGTPKDCWSF